MYKLGQLQDCSNPQKFSRNFHRINYKSKEGGKSYGILFYSNQNETHIISSDIFFFTQEQLEMTNSFETLSESQKEAKKKDGKRGVRLAARRLDVDAQFASASSATSSTLFPDGRGCRVDFDTWLGVGIRRGSHAVLDFRRHRHKCLFK